MLATMDWSAWVAWSVTLVTALGGLILGIRAERRAPRYSETWIFRGGMPCVWINRTGEDALNVRIRANVSGQPEVSRLYPHVAPDTDVQLLVPGPAGAISRPFDMSYSIEWVRPADGKRYQFPKSQRRWPFVGRADGGTS